MALTQHVPLRLSRPLARPALRLRISPHAFCHVRPPRGLRCASLGTAGRGTPLSELALTGCSDKAGTEQHATVLSIPPSQVCCKPRLVGAGVTNVQTPHRVVLSSEYCRAAGFIPPDYPTDPSQCLSVVQHLVGKLAGGYVSALTPSCQLLLRHQSNQWHVPPTAVDIAAGPQGICHIACELQQPLLWLRAPIGCFGPVVCGGEIAPLKSTCQMLAWPGLCTNRGIIERLSGKDGLLSDVRGRVPWYCHDWVEGARCGLRWALQFYMHAKRTISWYTYRLSMPFAGFWHHRLTSSSPRSSLLWPLASRCT